jgi:hypothetical protein
MGQAALRARPGRGEVWRASEDPLNAVADKRILSPKGREASSFAG